MHAHKKHRHTHAQLLLHQGAPHALLYLDHVGVPPQDGARGRKVTQVPHAHQCVATDGRGHGDDGVLERLQNNVRDARYMCFCSEDAVINNVTYTEASIADGHRRAQNQQWQRGLGGV